MKLIDCIKLIDLSNGIIEEEFKKHECLKQAIKLLNPYKCETFNPFNDQSKIMDTKELILILFKVVQELKKEIDTLKAN